MPAGWDAGLRSRLASTAPGRTGQLSDPTTRICLRRLDAGRMKAGESLPDQGSGMLTRITKITAGEAHNLMLRSPATVPTLTSVNPTSITAGTATFTFATNGADFASDSVILWNGTPLVTLLQTGTLLQATLPASYIANPGSATVTVGTQDDTYTSGYAQSVETTFPIYVSPVFR